MAETNVTSDEQEGNLDMDADDNAKWSRQVLALKNVDGLNDLAIEKSNILGRITLLIGVWTKKLKYNSLKAIQPISLIIMGGMKLIEVIKWLKWF